MNTSLSLSRAFPFLSSRKGIRIQTTFPWHYYLNIMRYGKFSFSSVPFDLLGPVPLRNPPSIHSAFFNFSLAIRPIFGSTRKMSKWSDKNYGTVKRRRWRKREREREGNGISLQWRFFVIKIFPFNVEKENEFKSFFGSHFSGMIFIQI